MEKNTNSLATNFLAASKVVINLSAAALLITTAFCMAELSLAAITVLLSPDYNCTPVDVEVQP